MLPAKYIQLFSIRDHGNNLHSPLPPLIFIGSAITENPLLSSLSRLATFSKAGMSFAKSVRWLSKSFDCPINAGGVETDSFYFSVLRQPARRIRMQAESEACDRVVLLVCAEVSFDQAEPSEASTQQHDGSRRYLSMPLFPILKSLS